MSESSLTTGIKGRAEACPHQVSCAPLFANLWMLSEESRPGTRRLWEEEESRPEEEPRPGTRRCTRGLTPEDLPPKGLSPGRDLSPLGGAHGCASSRVGACPH